MREAQVVGQLMNEREVIDMVNNLTLTGASMKLQDLREIVAAVDGSRLAGSISPDMVTNLMTKDITAELKEAFMKWPTTWNLWVSEDKSDYLDTQVREIVAQIGMIPALADSGGRFQEIKAPTIDEISFDIEGFGGFISADLKTRRSDHLNYFSKMGNRLGRAGVSRLHQYIYVTMLQANPDYMDGEGNSLFDNTNHLNDHSGASTGVALTYNNLNTVLQKFADIVDKDGEKLISGMQVILVCGTKLGEQANQIIKNPKKPGTANDEVNTLRDRIVGVDISRKLGWDWYLVAAKDELEGLSLAFYEGEKEPVVTAEATTGMYQFENPGKQRWRILHYYGGSWSYPGAIMRGSANVEPS